MKQPSDLQGILHQLTDRQMQPSCVSMRASGGQKNIKIPVSQSPKLRPFQRKQQQKRTPKWHHQDKDELSSNLSFRSLPGLTSKKSPPWGLKLTQTQKDSFNCIQTRSISGLDIDTERVKEPLSASPQICSRGNLCSNGNYNLLDLELKSVRGQNLLLKAKIKDYEEQIQKLGNALREKQNQIHNLLERNEKIEKQNNQRKQENLLLQEIIVKLNDKIDEMFQNQNINKMQKKNQQQKDIEIEQLKQRLFNFNRTLQNLQIQNMVINKLKGELAEEKNRRKRLEQQNKYLQDRITMILDKSRTNKKVSKNYLKQLDYSISFSFDEQMKSKQSFK